MDKQYTVGSLVEPEAAYDFRIAKRQVGTVGLREIIALFRRRFRFIVLFTIVCCVLLSIAVMSMKDTFSAASTLVLERSDAQMLRAVTQVEGEQQSRDRSAIETEMDIISSRVFAGRVVDALNLIEHPWFNTYLSPRSEAAKPAGMSGLLAAFKSALSGGGDSQEASQLPSPSAQRDRAISSLLDNMGVSRSGESFAVTIRVSTPDPDLSAILADTVANIYVDWSRELRQQTMSDAVTYLRDRAGQVAARIAENERAITDFRRLNALASSDRDDIVRKRLEELATLLTTAQGELAAVRARREQGQRTLAERGDFEGTALDSPLLATLRNERALLLRQRAQYSSNYGAGHPQVAQTDAQIASMASMLDTEIHRIVQDLVSEENVIGDRTNQLENQILEMQSILQRRSLAEIRLRELERDLLADQKLHDLIVARLGSLDPFTEIVKPSARVVSVAEIPTSPSFPQRGRIVAAGAVGAAILAAFLAVMLEASETRLQSGERISEIVNLRNLASIPVARRRFFETRQPLLDRLISQPESIVAESFRSLYLASLAHGASAKGVIVVTSALPREGATSVAQGLAFAAANDGLKTLLLNLDAHRPHVAAAATFADGGSAQEQPASEVEIAAIAGLNGLDSLTLTRASAAAGEAGSGNWSALRRLLRDLKPNYDLIVVDCPPVLIVEDANWLSSLADAMLLVVRYGQTTEQELISAVVRLGMTHAPLIGTVFNCVDPSGSRGSEPLGAASYPRHARAYLTG